MSLSSEARKAALLAAVSIAAAGIAAPAQAGSKILYYSCALPYIGVQPASSAVRVDYPATVPGGTPVAGQPISSSVSLNGDSTFLFELIGATTVSGVNRVGLTYTSPSATIPATVPVSVPSFTLLPTPAPPVFMGTGQTPTLTLPAGPVAISAGALSVVLQPKDSLGEMIPLEDGPGAEDGDPTTMAAACTPNAGQSTQIETFSVGAVNAPTITRIFPGTVQANKKSTVLISGTKLSGAVSVKVGGSAATFTVISKSLIQARVPALRAGTYPVTVSTSGGTSAVTATSTIKYVN